MKRLQSSLSHKAALQKTTEVCLPRHMEKWWGENDTGSLSFQRRRKRGSTSCLIPNTLPSLRDISKFKVLDLVLGQLSQWPIPVLVYKDVSRSCIYVKWHKAIRMYVLGPRKCSSACCILSLTVAESRGTVKSIKNKRSHTSPKCSSSTNSLQLTNFLSRRCSLSIRWPLIAFSFINLVNFEPT